MAYTDFRRGEMKLITRQTYLDKLLAVKDIPDIKVITGIRRSGKSKLMDAFVDLISEEKNINIVRIRLTLRKYKNLLDADALYDYIEEKHVDGVKNYLFIDEIQMCDGFEEIINSIHDEEIYDIYLTGSNAFLLSSDLATLFGGRVCEINMYPFSFAEYRTYYPDVPIDESFDSYVHDGGMAGSYIYPDEDLARQYVTSIYRSYDRKKTL
jgi:predicted AAA+ superfamily ATPase